MDFLCESTGLVALIFYHNWIITDFEFDAPTEPLLRELGTLNVRELIKYDTAVIMHKIKEMFHTIAQVHDMPLRNSEIDF